MMVGSEMAPAGSRNHSAAAEATMSMIENSSCRSAMDSEGRGEVPRWHCHSRTPRPIRASAAPACRRIGGTCAMAAAWSAAQSVASAPVATMPTAKATALNAMERVSVAGLTPAAP